MPAVYWTAILLTDKKRDVKNFEIFAKCHVVCGPPPPPLPYDFRPIFRKVKFWTKSFEVYWIYLSYVKNFIFIAISL